MKYRFVRPVFSKISNFYKIISSFKVFTKLWISDSCWAAIMKNFSVYQFMPTPNFNFIFDPYHNMKSPVSIFRFETQKNALSGIMKNKKWWITGTATYS